MIDQEMLKAYQDRWQTVAAIEATERQISSVTQRWRKMNALLRMAVGLELRLDRDVHSGDVVRARWNRLAELYLAEIERRDP